MHIVITGANRGIGQALADRYRGQGHQVTGTSRNGSTDINLDVTDPAQQTAMADRLQGVPIDLLICNAGVYLDKGHSIDEYPAEMWAQSFATNVTGVFLTVQALLPNLKAAQGKVVILSSTMASHTRAPGGSYIYRASKAAALNLGRNLATDLRSDGVAVGIYHPGWVQRIWAVPRPRSRSIWPQMDCSIGSTRCHLPQPGVSKPGMVNLTPIECSALPLEFHRPRSGRQKSP